MLKRVHIVTDNVKDEPSDKKQITAFIQRHPVAPGYTIDCFPLQELVACFRADETFVHVLIAQPPL